MRAKIISHTDKGKENKGVQESVGGEGEVFFPFGRLLIPVEASGFTLTTSKIQKITVETKNSIYELEIVEDIGEDKE